jgi:hypothetical protein
MMSHGATLPVKVPFLPVPDAAQFQRAVVEGAYKRIACGKTRMRHHGEKSACGISKVYLKLRPQVNKSPCNPVINGELCVNNPFDVHVGPGYKGPFSLIEKFPLKGRGNGENGIGNFNKETLCSAIFPSAFPQLNSRRAISIGRGLHNKGPFESAKLRIQTAVSQPEYER